MKVSKNQGEMKLEVLWGILDVFRSAGRGAGKNFIVRGRTSMEKQLPAVRKLELIPIERRNFPKANRKSKKIQRKEKKETMLQEDWSQ